MSILGKILKTGIDAASLPFSIATDIVTMGGAITDKDGNTYTGDKIRELINDVDEIKDECNKL